MRENLPLELLQRAAGLETELRDHRPPRVLIGRQRIGLPARAVEREHQLLAEAFAERILGDEALQLRDGGRVTSEREVGLDPVLDRAQPELLEPPDLALSEVLVRELGQCRPPPQAERLTKEIVRPRRVALLQRAPPFSRELLEPHEVEGRALERQAVAGRLRLEQVLLGPERLSERRDVVTDDLAGSRRRSLAPQVVDDPVGRDHLARVEQQKREERPMLRAAELNLPTFVDDLERSEHTKIHSARFDRRRAVWTSQDFPNGRTVARDWPIDGRNLRRWGAIGRDRSVDTERSSREVPFSSSRSRASVSLCRQQSRPPELPAAASPGRTSPLPSGSCSRRTRPALVPSGSRTRRLPSGSLTSRLLRRSSSRSRRGASIRGSTAARLRSARTAAAIEIKVPGGFHWGDAGVGVGAAVGVMLLAFGFVVVLRNSRPKPAA